MALLRMLAFRPAASSQSATGGGESKQSAKAPAPKVAAAPKSSAAQVATTGSARWQDDLDWSQLISQLGLKGATRLLAINCALLRRDADTVYFSLDGKSESMLTRPRQEAIAEALSAAFGETLRVNIEIGEAAPETPVQEESRMVGERYEAAKASLESDPNIQTLQTMFGAELKTDSIEPITPSQSD
jgi:DNA polymerase-3 subunit gamma/tau